MSMPRRDIEIHRPTIPAGQLVLAMLGSANRVPKQFCDAHEFDITRNPNPHIAFAQGIHACLGAALARMEFRIVLSDLLLRRKTFELASDEPWQPRNALHAPGQRRRRGYGEHDSKDLTQGFFNQLLERRSLETVSPDKGKFRSFLLASIDYFLADERDRAQAQKRGGGREPLSLDFEEAEGRYRCLSNRRTTLLT